MSNGPIDWEHPPSQRRRRGPIGRRLIFDAAVAGSASLIVQILLGALLGDQGVSERGIRHYMIDAQPGTHVLVWGVVVACSMAAIYAVVDAVRAVTGFVRDGRSGGPAPRA